MKYSGGAKRSDAREIGVGGGGATPAGLCPPLSDNLKVKLLEFEEIA